MSRIPARNMIKTLSAAAASWIGRLIFSLAGPEFAVTCAISPKRGRRNRRLNWLEPSLRQRGGQW